MYQKTIGYLLLTAGIFAIIFSTLSLYEVSTGRKKPPQVVSQQGISVDLLSLLNNSAPSESDKISPQKLEILSAQTISTSMNIAFYLVAMTFVSASGFKISSLGVQLLRPINIHSSVLS